MRYLNKHIQSLLEIVTMFLIICLISIDNFDIYGIIVIAGMVAVIVGNVAILEKYGKY